MIAGKWFYENRSFFQGNFDNNKPKGAGQWNFVDGNKVTGNYRQYRSAEDAEDDYKLVWKTTGDITA